MAEIESAVLAHCRNSGPAPPAYNPQAIKQLLKQQGWSVEVRVPPMTQAFDDRPSNDRYDAWKAFLAGEGPIGIGLEIEGWEINNDLLKFLRGQARGQIAVGVILHADPSEIAYSVEHYLRMAEPLWAGLPLVLCAPDGSGLPSYGLPEVKQRKLSPFVYPA